jgi:nicotinate-nucleotide adenylyltransferase
MIAGEDPTGGLRRRVRLLVPQPTEPLPLRPEPLRVGLLGGSFNPAHDGHLYLSIEALKRLCLDRIWWLVSPQNPLKASSGMAPLAERLATARRVARHPRIEVNALEARFGTRYTVDTLRRLKGWRSYRFVWLIGADNLEQLPRWKRWTEILATCPVAVIERQSYAYRALSGPVAHRLRHMRVAEAAAGALADHPPPAWTFLRFRAHPASSTAIRSRDPVANDPSEANREQPS